jgi:hypothetical protein
MNESASSELSPLATPQDISLQYGYVCWRNPSTTQTCYIRLLFDGGGIKNFQLEPRGSDRQGYTAGDYCYQYGTPLGSNCPNRTRIVPNCN